LLLNGCLSGNESSNESQRQEEFSLLEDYETIVSYESNILSFPLIIRTDEESNLFIYDSGIEKILKFYINEGKIIEFGREGRGPGEFVNVNNIFPVNNNLYILDNSQQIIHKFDNRGKFKSSRSSGPQSISQVPPPPPLPPLDISYIDVGEKRGINNQPHITANEEVILLNTQSREMIYKLQKWNRKIISELGQYPTGSVFELDYTKYRTEVSERVVPSLFKANVVIVNDRLNTDEYYLVYNSIPKISKYKRTGQKLWVKEVADTPEIIHLEESYYNTMDQILDLVNTILPLRKYVSGQTNNQGELYLSTYSFTGVPLYIHKFNLNGDLIHRYELKSDVDLHSLFAIDYDKERFIVITDGAEIRAYPF
jgi:hypothetical protein